MALNVAGPVSEGDFLVFANVGAYSISMGTEFLRPRVAVLQNREGDWRAVRQAGTPREVFPEIGSVEGCSYLPLGAAPGL